MNSKEQHLDEEMIFKAIVDESDLSPEALAHLSVCERCRLKKEGLEGDLSCFTSLADEAVPGPQRTIRLEAEDKGEAPFSWKAPAFAAVFIVMITLAGLFFLMPGSRPHVADKIFTVAELEADMEEDRLLVAGVMELEENIMPEIYSVLAGDTESDQYDEFIEFVFPMEDDINGA